MSIWLIGYAFANTSFFLTLPRDCLVPKAVRKSAASFSVGIGSAQWRVRTRSFGQNAVCPFTHLAILLFLVKHEANEVERTLTMRYDSAIGTCVTARIGSISMLRSIGPV